MLRQQKNDENFTSIFTPSFFMHKKTYHKNIAPKMSSVQTVVQYNLSNPQPQNTRKISDQTRNAKLHFRRSVSGRSRAFLVDPITVKAHI